MFSLIADLSTPPRKHAHEGNLSGDLLRMQCRQKKLADTPETAVSPRKDFSRHNNLANDWVKLQFCDCQLASVESGNCLQPCASVSPQNERQFILHHVGCLSVEKHVVMPCMSRTCKQLERSGTSVGHK